MEEYLVEDLKELVATARAALDLPRDFRPIRKRRMEQVHEDLAAVQQELEDWILSQDKSTTIARHVDQLCSILFCLGVHDGRWKKMIGLLGLVHQSIGVEFALQYRIIGGVDSAVQPMAIPLHEIWACRTETKCLFALYYDFPELLDDDPYNNSLARNFLHAAQAIFEGDLSRAVAPLQAVIRYRQLEDEDWLHYHSGKWPLFDPDATALARMYLQRGGDPGAFLLRERLYLCAGLG